MANAGWSNVSFTPHGQEPVIFKFVTVTFPTVTDRLARKPRLLSRRFYRPDRHSGSVMPSWGHPPVPGGRYRHIQSYLARRRA